jgi:DNA modification methylase
MINPGLSSDNATNHTLNMLHRLLNTDSFQTTEDALTEIKKGMSDAHKIVSWTHNLYKYPACFPATFPRSILNSFSKQNDWVLDPFVGGGTSAVEAMVSGRNFVGTDINELAIFSSKLKTTLISSTDARTLLNWSEELMLARTISERRENDEIYFINVPKPVELLSRKILTAIRSLPGKKLQNFAKGALLRLGQLEVEQRLTITDIKHAEELFKGILFTNLQQARTLHKEIQRNIIPDLQIHLANAGSPEVANIWNTSSRPFNLVLTSPPYPERHILYHKWQVKGRSETRLPYWIIESNQVESESFYTMSPRDSDASLEIYITNMLSVFENLNEVMEKNGVFVQVIAFSDVKRQLPVYLDTMKEAGFVEIKNIDTNSLDGRLWREVPNRRWFNRIDSARQCKEVILFHRKAKSI